MAKQGLHVHALSKIAKQIEGAGFPQRVLRESISDLIYILKKIEELIEPRKADFSSLNNDEARRLFKSIKLIRFYSQCLLLWGFRILEILEETSGHEIPHDIRIARNILVAHYGVAKGNLTSKLSMKQVIIDNPKISANGNFTYNLSPLGGPSSIASPLELLEIKQLYKKYCLEGSEPNTWTVCYKILCRNNLKITKKDLSKIKDFLKNNGGVFTTSHRIVDFVINSLNQYNAKVYDK
ncbi:MAG: hypothetical protein NWE85_07680 [Candidatus Bathyarchaeota archaeon]|nr:hypothetical protein [Candidatus Bathyarchaeota archaeon]